MIEEREGFWYESADEHGLVPLLSRYDEPVVNLNTGQIIGMWHKVISER